MEINVIYKNYTYKQNEKINELYRKKKMFLLTNVLHISYE